MSDWTVITKNHAPTEIHDAPTHYDENGTRIGETPNLIATLGHHNSNTNARLIAAAPDLLAALENLFDVVIEREQGNHDLDEELDAAQAAINKAILGRSHE